MSTDLHVRACGSGCAPLFSLCRRFASLVLFIAICSPGSHAGPLLYLEESARLTGPSPDDVRPLDAAVDNENLAIVAANDANTWDLHRYERDANGNWNYAELLYTATPADQYDRPSLSLRGTIIALAQRNAVHTIQRPFSTWIYGSTLTPPPGFGEFGSDVEQGGSGNPIVVAGETNGRMQALRFFAVPRVSWYFADHVDGGFAIDRSDFFGGDIATDYESTAVGSPSSQPPESARIYVASGRFGNWSKQTVLSPPPGQDPSGFGRYVALTDQTLITTSFEGALHLYDGTNWAWAYRGTTRAADTLSRGIGSPAIWDDLIAHSMNDDDRGPNTASIAVYRREGSRLRQVAELYRSDSAPRTFSKIDLRGRTVVATAEDGVFVYELPANLEAPAIIQDDFEQGAGAWTPSLSGVWSIATVGTNNVYRQTNLGGAAHSIRGDANWTNQSVEAYIRPIAFQTTQAWFGLATRYRDANNHYYVTARSDGSLVLRKKVAGVTTTLDSAPLTVSADQRYRLRLEAIGTRIRAYVNETLMLEAIDDALDRGRAALLTYRTRADFDNVLISPNPLIELFKDEFPPFATLAWSKTMGTWVDPVPTRTNFLQTSIGGVARASTGAATDDQYVQAEITATRLVSPASWVGIFARHTNDANYYYLKLGADGQASLRKTVNSTITELAHAPFTLQPNVVYRVRLEAVGATLRAYVNERFLFSATDSSHASGRYGLITYTATAAFDDVRVHQP